MKIIKFIAAVSALTLLCGCLDISFLMQVDIEPPTPPVPNKMPEIIEVRDKLHSSGWYTTVCEELLKGESTIFVDDIVDNRDIEMLFYLIPEDYPEISWTGARAGARVVTDGSKVTVDFFRDFDSSEIEDILADIDKAADEIISQIPKDADDYEKVLFVHDYLIENTVYDHDAADDSGEFDFADSSYGCLIEGEAVCSGYSKAFQYIMKKLGIDSGVSMGSKHEWNYVKVDGEYYWLDATWDDNDNDYAQHTYFLFTTEQLLRTRTFELFQPIMPECGSDEGIYFKKNGGYFEEYDADAVISYISGHSDDKQAELMFGSFDAYAEAIDSLFAKSKIYKAKGLDLGNVRYYRNDDMFTLTIIY